MIVRRDCPQVDSRAQCEGRGASVDALLLAVAALSEANDTCVITPQVTCSMHSFAIGLDIYADRARPGRSSDYLRSLPSASPRGNFLTHAN